MTLQEPGNRMEDHTKSLDSASFASAAETRKRLPGWIRVGAFAAASALAGGLAATWFYRKTLSRLQNAEEMPENSNFGISENGTSDED